jgi:hypothetical protein
MPSIEFLYYEDCPSHHRALALLREVAAHERVNAPITVIQVHTDDEARRYGFFGSPTIRIDGMDIAPLPDGVTQPGLSCRAYRTTDGRISPLPPAELLAAALQKLQHTPTDQAERND